MSGEFNTAQAIPPLPVGAVPIGAPPLPAGAVPIEHPRDDIAHQIGDVLIDAPGVGILKTIGGAPGIPLEMAASVGNFMRRNFGDGKDVPLSQTPLKDWGMEGWLKAAQRNGIIPDNLPEPKTEGERIGQKAGGILAGGAVFGPAALAATPEVLAGSEAGRVADKLAPELTHGYGEFAGGFAGPLVRPTIRAAPQIASTIQQASQRLLPRAPVQLPEGVDPSALSADLSKQYQNEAQRAVDPDQALVLAKARSLPKPVPLTTGQLTGDPEQMLFEDMARQGSKGQVARHIMERAAQDTRDALFGNIEALQGKIAGTSPVIEPGQGMANAQTAIVGKAKAAADFVTRAYKAAREGGDAGVDQGAWVQGTQDIKNTVATNFRPGNVPKTWGILEDLFGTGLQGGEVTPLVSKIFDARQQLTALQREGGVEGAAARQAKSALDTWSDSLDETNLTGDKAAVGRWKRAIASRAQFAKDYGGGMIADMIERDPQAGNRLVIDPSQAADKLLGKTAMTAATKTDLTRNLTQLRDALGEASPEWSQVRQELFMRLGKSAEGGPMWGDAGNNQFSPVQFAKTWDAFYKQNPELVKLILKPDELATMKQLRDVIGRTIVKPGGRQLGSAAAWSNMITSTFPTISRFFGIVGKLPIVDELTHIPSSVKASQAAAGTLPRIAHDLRAQPAPMAARTAPPLVTEPPPVTPSPREPVIAAAATRIDGKVYTGRTHADAVEAWMKQTGKSIDDIPDNVFEGFITSDGRLIDRATAARMMNESQHNSIASEHIEHIQGKPLGSGAQTMRPRNENQWRDRRRLLPKNF